jgi:nicotinate-nucleotide adenylyltransferase
MRIGLLGGTFDPIHVGHLDVAREAIAAAGLDELWIVPAETPPHRRHPHASAAHRFAMAALAVMGDPRLRLSDREMGRMGPSYTVDTLDGILGSPTATGHTWHFVIGADAFADVPTWRAYPDILERCHFIVVSRPGHSAMGLADRLPALRPRMVTSAVDLSHAPKILLVDALTADVSSTAVRAASAAGAPLAGLVSASVGDYIQRQRLYRPNPETPAA